MSKAQTGKFVEFGPEAVSDYLLTHPDFFIDHPEVLKELQVPHLSGNAVSLVEKQLILLREQNEQTQKRLHELIEIARQNEELARSVIEGDARIDALPEGYRAVFVLRALEELSVEETAAALQLAQATVRTRFFRARSLLRETLARDIDLTLDDAFSFAGERCDRIVAAVLGRIAAGT